MFKVGLDNVNKSAQFKLKDNLSAVSLDLVGSLSGDDNVKRLTFSEIGADMNVRVELIRKNQPNAILTDLPLDELSKVIDILYKGEVKNTIPMALDKNLVLSDEAYLLVTLDWRNISLTKLEVFENRVLGETSSPISIKSVEIDEQTEVNTEFYNAVVFDDQIKSLETVYTDIDDDGVAHSQKQEITFDYMKLFSTESQGVVFITEADQRVKFFGTGKVYLVQAS